MNVLCQFEGVKPLPSLLFKLHKTPHFVDCIFPAAKCAEQRGSNLPITKTIASYWRNGFFVFRNNPDACGRRPCVRPVLLRYAGGVCLSTPEGTRWSGGTLPATAVAEHSERLCTLDFITQQLAGLTFRAPRSRLWWQPQWAKKRHRSQRG